MNLYDIHVDIFLNFVISFSVAFSSRSSIVNFDQSQGPLRHNQLLASIATSRVFPSKQLLVGFFFRALPERSEKLRLILT